MNKLSIKNYKKIGILGGTFDPPHMGHIYISKVAIKKFKLNKLIWIITKKNPLKQKPYLNIKTRIKLSKHITKNETCKIRLRMTHCVSSALIRSSFECDAFILFGNGFIIELIES